MAKIRNTQIGPGDLTEYLDKTSDFAFELRCLDRLLNLGFQCQHGGSYDDPITKKPRQFDLRAQMFSRMRCIRCAIECKNLTSSFPLLIMCVPRIEDESFHELLISFDPAILPTESQYDPPALRPYCQALRIDAPKSVYAIGSPVGKSVAQVGRGNDGSIFATDSEVFEKWSQALASAQELIDSAAAEGEESASVLVSLILPIFVVPDGTLWQVDYDERGSRTGSPVNIDRCSLCAGRDYMAGDNLRGTMLTISHLEFVTLSGLECLAMNLLKEDSSWFSLPDDLKELTSETRA